MPATLQPGLAFLLVLQDMTRLSYLHEPGVLWNIKSRYTYDDIYTYTGSILIAVNPFAPLPHLYGPHMMDQYRGVDLGDLSPHVYAIADAAYRQMRKELKGQSILVRTALDSSARDHASSQWARQLCQAAAAEARVEGVWNAAWCFKRCSCAWDCCCD
jgi:hypothetical protein